MAGSGVRKEALNMTRRKGYLILFVCAAAIHLLLALAEQRVTVGAIITVILLLLLLSNRLSLQRMEQLLLWSINLGAALMLWTTVRLEGSLGSHHGLIYVIFVVVWFGILPFRQAAIQTGVLYSALLTISLTQLERTDLTALMYIGFVALLVAQMTVSGRQIEQELSETARYADLAMTDSLTDLHNRRSMYTHLQEHYARKAAGRPVRAVGVVLADIDHFKQVNDTYGHDVGDQVLQHVAGVLRSCVRPGDEVSRWGGEEFLLLVEAGDLTVLEQICQRLLYTLKTVNSGLPPVTLSLGVALASEAQDVNGLLRLADRRLYRAKRAGRNQMNMDILNAKTTLLDSYPGATSKPQGG